MAANAEIFFEHERWGRALTWSVGLHVAIVASLLVYSAVFTGPSGQGWGAGGGGEAMGATLVSTVPLPASARQTENILANESKGLTKSQPKPEKIEPDAIEIQGKNAKIKPKKIETATKAKPQPAPVEETNQVAFGEGGPVSGPYGSFSAGGAKGGFDGSTSLSISRVTGIPGMCRWSNPAACRRSTFPLSAPFRGSTLLGRCRRIIPAAKSPWNSGLTIRGEPHR